MAVFMAVLARAIRCSDVARARRHLTHGTKVSFSGKLYNAIAYASGATPS